MYVMSVDHTWFLYSISKFLSKYGIFFKIHGKKSRTVYGDGINIAWKNNAYMLYASQGHDRYLGTTSDYRYDNLVVTYGKYNSAITDLDTRVRDKAAADHEHEPIDYPSVLIGQTPVKAGQLGYYNNVLLLKVR